ncbi:MAG TPA: VIT1/CCC1 transporter family protein [Polyangiaceae bacterium]|nr:VIT1/CCC1 transporter family protein [Polyangiaceae bacterium]
MDPHRRASWLSDVILGGQDGIVNVLGVILGVAAASQSPRLTLVAGLAAALAESASMAAVAYTSSIASGDYYRGERAREYRHIAAVPELERAEIREIYVRKGFDGELLDRIVETITGDKEVWVAVMMAEEHGLTDTSRSASLRSASVVGIASLVGSLLPLGPFVLAPVKAASWVAVVLSAAALFALGAYKAKATVGRPWKSGLELACIGTVSALLGYGIGSIFQTAGP